MPQKLITRKVDLPIVNLPVKCWRPCGSIEVSEKKKRSLGEVIIVAFVCKDTISVQEAAGLRPRPQTHQKTHQFNFVPHREDTNKTLKNEYCHRRSFRKSARQPTGISRHYIGCWPVEYKENTGQSDDPGLAAGPEKICFQ